MQNSKNPLRVVTIGGGKGQGTVLTGLKKYSYRLDISAIVSMVDNGGSTGRLREELGIASFGGDFRDVMTSLCLNQTIVDLFQHRYERGSDIKGHSVGNLILLGLLEQCQWNIPEAIAIACEILDIKHHHIYPSTLDQVHLVAKYFDGEIVKGQDQIDNNFEKKYQTIEKVYTEPKGTAYEPAVAAIKEADAVILCPGDIYGSLLCNLVIPGMQEAIAASSAKLIYITNLMTKVNQTHGWKSSQFLDEIQRYLPRKLDFAIVNTGMLSSRISGKDQYAKESWEMVENDLQAEDYKGTKLVKDTIWFEGQEFKRVSSDVIPRSFIRHDPEKIASIVMGLIA